MFFLLKNDFLIKKSIGFYVFFVNKWVGDLAPLELSWRVYGVGDLGSLELSWWVYMGWTTYIYIDIYTDIHMDISIGMW